MNDNKTMEQFKVFIKIEEDEEDIEEQKDVDYNDKSDMASSENTAFKFEKNSKPK